MRQPRQRTPPSASPPPRQAPPDVIRHRPWFVCPQCLSEPAHLSLRSHGPRRHRSSASPARPENSGLLCRREASLLLLSPLVISFKEPHAVSSQAKKMPRPSLHRATSSPLSYAAQPLQVRVTPGPGRHVSCEVSFFVCGEALKRSPRMLRCCRTAGNERVCRSRRRTHCVDRV